MPNILDKDFKYVSAEHTDIRKTFKRARRELARKESERFKALLPEQNEVRKNLVVTELQGRRVKRSAA